jgi:hypothetical protein
MIAATTTGTGPKVRAELDENKYPKSVKVPDAQLAAVNLARHSFPVTGNYTILPKTEKIHLAEDEELTELFVDAPLSAIAIPRGEARSAHAIAW